MTSVPKTIAADTLEFALFCIESTAEKLGISGTRMFDLLTKESNLLYGYIIPCCDILHTQGKEYIVNDIIELLLSKGVHL